MKDRLEHVVNVMNVKDIVGEWLVCEGCGGLLNECCDFIECGCILDDLMPCTGDQSTCEPGYVFFCTRCACSGVCEKRSVGYDWIISTYKDYCAPDYVATQPAAQDAAAPAALPACEAATVDEVMGGLVRNTALRIVENVINSQESSAVETVCQNTAKSKASDRVLPDGEAARLFSYLQFGA